MTLIATDYPLIPAEATDKLEGRGYKVFLSTESSLEAGDGAQILQVIRLEDGEYRATRLPQDPDGGFAPEAWVLPEMGEVLKWLDADGHPKS